jgi:hypothetical protein
VDNSAYARVLAKCYPDRIEDGVAIIDLVPKRVMEHVLNMLHRSDLPMRNPFSLDMSLEITFETLIGTKSIYVAGAPLKPVDSKITVKELRAIVDIEQKMRERGVFAALIEYGSPRYFRTVEEGIITKYDRPRWWRRDVDADLIGVQMMQHLSNSFINEPEILSLIEEREVVIAGQYVHNAIKYADGTEREVINLYMFNATEPMKLIHKHIDANPSLYIMQTHDTIEIYGASVLVRINKRVYTSLSQIVYGIDIPAHAICYRDGTAYMTPAAHYYWAYNISPYNPYLNHTNHGAGLSNLLEAGGNIHIPPDTLAFNDDNTIDLQNVRFKFSENKKCIHAFEYLNEISVEELNLKRILSGEYEYITSRGNIAVYLPNDYVRSYADNILRRIKSRSIPQSAIRGMFNALELKPYLNGARDGKSEAFDAWVKYVIDTRDSIEISEDWDIGTYDNVGTEVERYPRCN